MLLASLGISLGVLLALAPPCPAQAAGHTGVQVERFHWESDRLVAVTVRHSDLGSRGLGADVAVGLMPIFLPTEVVLPFEAGLAKALRVGPSTLVLKAGVAGLLLGRQLELIPGSQLGAAVLLPVEQRLELRTDIIRRRYWSRDSGTLDMGSIGVGFAVRRPSRPGTTSSPERP
ncbi:MAG TPA: hypothetical protein VEB59_07615 [Gemmatimonadales bacterium]|nr:hypothetical protein [Gemmatimonadales bacterium]